MKIFKLKIASTDTILLNVKVGSEAFMKTLKKDRLLANILIKIGNYFKKDAPILITDMQEPLGNVVGNILEVNEEAIETLKNNGPKDFAFFEKNALQ